MVPDPPIGEINMEYQLIRSGRRTLGLQVGSGGDIIVRAPFRCSINQIEAFIRKQEPWIRKQREKRAREESLRVSITPEMRKDGIRKAKQILPEKTAFYAARMGTDYHGITIREQKTRWGSCSSKGNLNFNWKLVLLPEPLLDYVVVHELSHRFEMNHSFRFWRIVESQLPDYRLRRKMLREIGGRYI